MSNRADEQNRTADERSISGTSLALARPSSDASPTSKRSAFDVVANRTQPSAVDLDWALQQISVAYGVDAFDSRSGHYARVVMIYEDAQLMGITATEFRTRLTEMRRSCKFPSWTPADFWATSVPAVYDHRWYCERLKESIGNRRLVGVYATPSGPVYGWRHEIGALLPAYEGKTRGRAVSVDERGLSGEPEDAALGITDETKKAIQLLKDNANLREELARWKAEAKRVRADFQTLREWLREADIITPFTEES